jgi:hypothetical protein
MAVEGTDAEAHNGVRQGCADEESTSLVDDYAGAFNDDDATVATAQNSLNGNASNELLAAWALAKVSSIHPMSTLLLNRASRSSLLSEDDDDDGGEEDEENNESASASEASVSSMKGLDNISVGSDVILPFRFSYRTSLRDARSQTNELGSSEVSPSAEPEKALVDQLDVTSETTSTSTPSSQSSGSTSESYEADDDGADDVDSDMTLGEAASQIIDYTNESDDDLESKASSSRFTPDEFWDWLDNVQVAFIEVGNRNLPRRSKARGSSSPAVSKAFTAVSKEPLEEPSFSDTLQTTEEDGMYGHSFEESPIRVAVDQRDALRDEGPDGEAFLAMPNHRSDESLHENDNVRLVPSHAPLLKQSASVADFRSHSEQDQQHHRMLSCSIRRNVSFADAVVVPSSCAGEPNDEGAARMRRISSNEDLLVTLHRREILPFLPKSASSSGLKAVSSMTLSEREKEISSAALVCYEPRVRIWSRLLVLFSAIYALAFVTSNLANLFYEELPGTCKPRALTIDLENPLIPSLEEVRGTFEASTTAAADSFRFLKENLPETMEQVNLFLEESKMSAFELYNHLKDHLPSGEHTLNPRMVRVDVPNYAAVAYQEAVEVIKASRTLLVGGLLSHSERQSDQRWTESVDLLQSTLARCRATLIKHLSELCRSSAIDGPKAVVFGACDALYETLATAHATPDVSEEPGPPQLVFDRPFIRRSFDAMANETLSYIGRFATAIHELCSEVQGHCQRTPSSAFPHVQSEDSHTTKASIDGPIAAQAIDSASKQSGEPFGSQGSGCEQATAPVNDSHSSATINPAAPGDLSKAGGEEVAVSERVREILLHLDARGRLNELEDLLEEKFGPGFVDPPSTTVSFDTENFGLMPLLGRERDRQLRERLLNRLEQEVVEATMRDQPQSLLRGFDWAAHIKGRVQSVSDLVASRDEAGTERVGDE